MPEDGNRAKVLFNIYDYAQKHVRPHIVQRVVAA